MGDQTNHVRNMILSYKSNSRFESDYESICIVIVSMFLSFRNIKYRSSKKT